MLAVYIDFDELDRFTDAVAKAVLVAYTVRDVSVVVELLDIVRSIAGYGRGIAVVGEGSRINPGL